jgi:rare lipoprotein A
MKLEWIKRITSAAALIIAACSVAAASAGAETAVAESKAAPTAAETDAGGQQGRNAAAVSRVRLVGGRVRHGSRVKVKGMVERSSSSARIYFRPSDSKRWQRLKKVETGRSGRYSTSVTARRNGRIRTVSSAGTASKPTKIRVRSRISVERVKKYTPVGSRVVIRGAVRPAGRRMVKVVVGGPRGSVLRTRTSYRGGFRLSWKPRSTGRYRVRVLAAGNGQAASDSSRRIRVTGLRRTHASYFGPGLYGGALACGGRLYPGTRGVAHKSLPCGSKVTLRYRGRTVVTRVVDRGPFVAGREFDLTAATRNDLGFGDLGYVWTDR